MAPHYYVPPEQRPLPAPDAVGRLLPDNESPPACAMAGESEDLPYLWAAGCATPVPGQTKEQSGQIIVNALHRAAAGMAVLATAGQKGAWLNKCFIKSQLNVGEKSWKFFKVHHGEIIELDKEQQWVRLRGLAL